MTTKEAVTGEQTPARVSWEQWRSLLSHDEENQIALEVGLMKPNGEYDMSKADNFEALLEFRRSQKLFNQLRRSLIPWTTEQYSHSSPLSFWQEC